MIGGTTVKRITAYICLLLTLVGTLLVPVSAAKATAPETQAETIYLENGDYIIVELEQTTATRQTAYTSGTKNYTYYNASNEAEWQIQLNGSFSYTGETAKCTGASCTVNIYNSNWYVISKSAAPSYNSAVATVEMGKKLLGIKVFSDTYTVKLTCDKYGKLT